MEENKIINDYRNYIFFRFDKKDFKELDSFFQNEIYSSINYMPKKILFESDVASRLKKNFSFVELVFVLAITLIFTVFLMFLIAQLSLSSLRREKDRLFFLYFQGHSSRKLSFCFFLINFFCFFVASLIGFFWDFF